MKSIGRADKNAKFSDPQGLEDFKNSWKRFEKWEHQQPQIKNRKEVIHQIGQWVDFFLKRNPLYEKSPNLQGIRQMRKYLSRLSC